MKELQRYFRERLGERGLRVTRGRRAILDHAFRHFGHFDAEAMLESLNQHGAKVSRATVYRTLTQLVEIGLLRRHDLGGRQTLYEPAFGRAHHEHLVCVQCGAIFEFVQQQIEKMQDEICRRHNFKPLSHTLQIHGLCENCQQGGGRSDRAQERGELAPGKRKAASGQGRE